MSQIIHEQIVHVSFSWQFPSKYRQAWYLLGIAEERVLGNMVSQASSRPDMAYPQYACLLATNAQIYL